MMPSGMFSMIVAPVEIPEPIKLCCRGFRELHPCNQSSADGSHMRKLIAFDEDTFDKLKQLARDRMATLQELADEAFADLLKKHGIPIDLKDALRKSASIAGTPVGESPNSAA